MAAASTRHVEVLLTGQSFAKALTATQAQVATLGKDRPESLPATQAQVATLAKAMPTALTASAQASAATLTKGKTQAVAAATQAQSATLHLLVSQATNPFVTQDQVATLTKAKTQSVAAATQASAATLTKAMPVAPSATQPQAATVTHTASVTHGMAQPSVAHLAISRLGALVNLTATQAQAASLAVDFAPACETTRFVDPAGVVHALSNAGDLDGWSGRFMPPSTLLETVVPGTPGSFVDGVQVGARDVLAPVLIEGADAAGTRVAVRALVRAMNPQRGDGQLQVATPDGSARTLFCRATAGLALDEKFGSTRAPTLQLAVVTFHASDPYWYDRSPVTRSWSLAPAPTLFFKSPFFPLALGASDASLTVTVTNDGDVDAYPVWTLTGPATQVTLTNQATGESLTVTALVSAGDTVTVDTRRGQKSVMDQAGDNLFGDLAVGSDLWPLVPGPNVVDAEVVGVGPGSALALSYVNAWLTP